MIGYAKANELEFCYEMIGEKDKPVVLLIMGLGCQLIHWSDSFYHGLAEQGFQVIRFDNRDMGLSSNCDHLGFADVKASMENTAKGLPIETIYTVNDMAKDAHELLNALGIEKAHIIGASLGGIVAQKMAVNYPKQLLSLTSLISTTGNPKLPVGDPKALATLTASPGRHPSQAEVEEFNITIGKVIHSQEFGDSDEVVRALAGRAYQRNYHPAGVARQLLAGAASGNRVAELAQVTAPTLVVHGTEDPLLPPACAEDTAKAIPNAQLHLVDGMGHDLPEALTEKLLSVIVPHLQQHS